MQKQKNACDMGEQEEEKLKKISKYEEIHTHSLNLSSYAYLPT